MTTFRKFDPYAFLADRESARSEVSGEAPETLAALATLAAEHPPSGKERTEVDPSTGKSTAQSAKAAKFAKADDDEGRSLATSEPEHSQNENVSSGSTAAKAAKPANSFDASVGVDTWGATQEERAAIVEHDGGIPRAWAEGFARLHPDQPPGDVPLRRWHTFVDDCGRFLDGGWAKKAALLGWGPLDLFGADGEKPFARIDQFGLIWLLKERRVVALTENTATIETKAGVRQTYHRKTSGRGRVLAWELE